MFMGAHKHRVPINMGTRKSITGARKRMPTCYSAAEYSLPSGNGLRWFPETNLSQQLINK